MVIVNNFKDEVNICKYYGKYYLGECWKNLGACFKYGLMEHMARQSALVYAVRGSEERDVSDVITGSTHSYVAYNIPDKLRDRIEETATDATILSPLGQLVIMNKIYRRCTLEVQVLVEHQVSLNYAFKRVSLNREIFIVGEQHDYLSNFFSAMYPIVREFLDVFPEELPGSPPDCEVEFRTELFLGTALVSIAPYRMALKELQELKIHVQELLDCRFIRTSISLWGASIFFEKKDGSLRLYIDY
ncbi:DNA/RNA polymerases superfamily protein [Gossypium australe]|uniref:DNA/RNA polymerases superfamily protein n=1 Tax=Gossypium australe TaxID=47621 RepID=A0A5B6VYG0_9ROSI|nr:DNA/RNA polymerases superfamily protein [Gossypium australe]